MNRSLIVRVAPGDDMARAAEAVATDILGTTTPATHPDFEVFRADGNVFRVGVVEEIVFRSVLAPVGGEKRVFAVLEPERMSDTAANLLLKTLEEPPPSLHLLFVTSRPFDLPDTIRSRCGLVDGPAVDREAPLVAAGLLPEEARRLAYLAGSSERAERVADDPEQRLLLHSWLDLVAQASPTPGDCLALTGPIEGLLSQASGGDEETRRRQRRERTDELLAGLRVISCLYREVVARALGAPLPAPAVEVDPAAPLASGLARTLGVEGALAGLGHVATTREAILANGSVRLALEALALRLGALAASATEAGPGPGAD